MPLITLGSRKRPLGVGSLGTTLEIDLMFVIFFFLGTSSDKSLYALTSVVVIVLCIGFALIV